MQSIKCDLENAGHGRMWDGKWGVLGFTSDEIIAALHSKAQAIRDSWETATHEDKHFANWVAIRTATEAITSVRHRIGGRVVA